MLLFLSSNYTGQNIEELSGEKRYKDEGGARTSQISKTERLATLAKSGKSLTVVAKLSIFDICGGPGYT